MIGIQPNAIITKTVKRWNTSVKRWRSSTRLTEIQLYGAFKRHTSIKKIRKRLEENGKNTQGEHKNKAAITLHVIISDKTKFKTDNTNNKESYYIKQKQCTRTI